MGGTGAAVAKGRKNTGHATAAAVARQRRQHTRRRRALANVGVRAARAFGRTRRDDGDVRQVAATGLGVVGDEDVAVLEVVDHVELLV